MSDKFRPSGLDRRRFLKWSAISGLAAAVPGLACSPGDEDVFATDTSGVTTPPSTAATTSTTAGTTTTESSAAATQPDSTAVATTEAPTTTVADTPGARAGLGPGELVFNVTYTMGSGGKKLNPYLAIWIENEGGEVLRTMEVWYQQSEKGPRWLPDLKRWFVVDQSRITGGGGEIIDTVSSATRQPDKYSFVWDGLDQDGAPVLDEVVVAHVETARENGPYSLIRAEVTRGTGEEIALPENGELSAASVIVGV